MMQKNEGHIVATVSELPVTSGHLPSYQKLLDTAIDLSFPASDSPAISACNRCMDKPLSSREKEAYQPFNDKVVQQEISGREEALRAGGEIDWALKAERIEDSA